MFTDALTFAVKLVLVGTTVYGLQWIAGRFGVRLAGAMNGMPLISAPALVLAYMQGGGSKSAFIPSR